MGWTLQSLKAELGQPRIDRALRETQAWMPRGYPMLEAFIQDNWRIAPRKTLRHAYMAMGFAGVKSHADKYLVVARALGKV